MALVMVMVPQVDTSPLTHQAVQLNMPSFLHISYHNEVAEQCVGKDSTSLLKGARVVKKKIPGLYSLCMLIYDFLDHGYNIGALKVHCYTFTKYW